MALAPGAVAQSSTITGAAPNSPASLIAETIVPLDWSMSSGPWMPCRARFAHHASR